VWIWSAIDFALQPYRNCSLALQGPARPCEALEGPVNATAGPSTSQKAFVCKKLVCERATCLEFVLQMNCETTRSLNRLTWKIRLTGPTGPLGGSKAYSTHKTLFALSVGQSLGFAQRLYVQTTEMLVHSIFYVCGFLIESLAAALLTGWLVLRKSSSFSSRSDWCDNGVCGCV